MSKMIVMVVCLSCLLFRGCAERSEGCRQFLDLPRQQRQEQFKTYSVEKQLDVYLCAMNVEPPDLSLADKIADRGETAIPSLIEKLKTSQREIDQEDIIYVFEVMSDRGLLRGRKDVIAEISQVIDNMKISQEKQTSEERLKKIEINSGIKPFTYAP
jgi:hypothetical protein